MPRLKTSPKAFLQDSSGATAIEYALIASMISIVIVGTLFAMHDSMIGVYDKIHDFIIPALEGDGS